MTVVADLSQTRGFLPPDYNFVTPSKPVVHLEVPDSGLLHPKQQQVVGRYQAFMLGGKFAALHRVAKP
jgi:hypothetical protein